MTPVDGTDTSEIETVPAPAESRVIVSTVREVPSTEIAPHQMSGERQLPAALRVATDVGYSLISFIVILMVAASIITLLAWFGFDITHINTHSVPPGVTDQSTYIRDQVINAVANLLANLVLVLVLLEVVTQIVGFFRTRKASARPLLLIPLFVVTRGIILLANQLITTPASGTNYQPLIESLAEMGALALVGLFLSFAISALRENPGRNRAS